MPNHILLINPPYKSAPGYSREGRCTHESSFWSTSWPPYSLASIAATIRENRTIRLMDLSVPDLPKTWFENFFDQNKPDIVISSTSTQTYTSDLNFLQKIKEITQAKIIVFGVHATMFAEDILANSRVDIIVRNEPEETLKELIPALEKDQDLRTIKGITFKTPNGQTVVNEQRVYLEDLDSLPFPAWDLVDLSLYKLPLYGRKYIIINTLRGCPFRCSFCSTQVYYGHKSRIRSVPSLLEEIKFNIDNYGIRDVFFWGDTFTLKRDQITGLCKGIIKNKLDIHWVANSRVDTVDKEMLDLMKKAGIWLLSVGIESGDDKILKRCRKNTTVEKITTAVALIQSSGIKIAGHIIFGLPGETEATAQKTLNLIKTLKLDFVALYSAAPFPGSPLYKEALQQGWIEGKNWADFNQSNFIMDLPTISKKKLQKFKRRAFRIAYFQPKSLKTILSMITFQSFISSVINAIRYIIKKI